MKNLCSSLPPWSPRHGYMKDQEDMRRGLWPKWHMAGPEAASQQYAVPRNLGMGAQSEGDHGVGRVVTQG